MTFVSLALALGLAGPTSGPPRQAPARVAVADAPFVPPPVVAKPLRRRVGLCLQFAGRHVGAARVAVPSRDAAWDAGMLQQALQMQPPAALALPAGAWVALWIRDPTADGGGAAAGLDDEAAQPVLNCAG